LLNRWLIGALAAPMGVWPSWLFRADVFRLAKAPAKSDRTLRFIARFVSILLHKI
jgi:hypothetical protein